MSKPIRQLAADDVWSAFEMIDPVAVLAEELIGRAVAGPERELGSLAGWAGSPGRAQPPDLVLCKHSEAGIRCVLPASSLREFQAAAFASLAARELLVPGGVTVAMLGAPQATQPQLAVLARHVPDISHVAICLADVNQSSLLEPKLIDQLDLSGIGLSVVTTLADTVFGANLILAATEGATRWDLDRLQFGQLAEGTVLINATGRDLPAGLVNNVDGIYVDDVGLLEANRHRHIVASHLGESESAGTDAVREPRIVADLGQLLIGAHAGREQVDDILLVELLGTDQLNLRLALETCRAAQRCGLGTELTR